MKDRILVIIYLLTFQSFAKEVNKEQKRIAVESFESIAKGDLDNS